MNTLELETGLQPYCMKQDLPHLLLPQYIEYWMSCLFSLDVVGLASIAALACPNRHLQSGLSFGNKDTLSLLEMTGIRGEHTTTYVAIVAVPFHGQNTNSSMGCHHSCSSSLISLCTSGSTCMRRVDLVSSNKLFSL